MLLKCNSSLRVPPLLAYVLSNLDVILLLVNYLVLCPASDSNLTTALLLFIQFRRYCETLRKSWLYDS